MGTREDGKLQRREDIVKAARSLMRDGGDLTFSMRTLASQAGVSIATPYNLFGSKQAILLAVLDADLADYQASLAGLHADGVDVLFEAVSLMTNVLSHEPAFYRTVLAAVCRDDATELRHMISGPRYVLWKNLLSQATEAGLLRPDVDPDAITVTIGQTLSANLQSWALGQLGLEEMEARIRYALALVLLAIAMPASRALIEGHMRAAETRLQTIWRAALRDRLQAGSLDEEARTLLADQLKHVEHHYEDIA